jgi:hypothetical protein
LRSPFHSMPLHLQPLFQWDPRIFLRIRELAQPRIGNVLLVNYLFFRVEGGVRRISWLLSTENSAFSDQPYRTLRLTHPPRRVFFWEACSPERRRQFCFVFPERTRIYG